MFKRLLPLLFVALCWITVTPPVAARPLQPVPVAAIFSFPGSRPANLGLTRDRLAACPPTPNCVSSLSLDPTHQVEPLRYTSSPEQAFTTLKHAIAALPRTQVISETDSYLYAEFTSPLMGFVDDVEFYVDKPAGVIHVRSASRLGESDLGANRKRVELIRTKLQAAENAR
ncbi:DUF1499 domain-containing protein [Myxacorys almedinensis]|uniref:DUF1499 domain-containing protein n=1 Tax=Myxacorys almedinensis A TaxID=2690445 RepID=A0A8J8CLV2_9CYAN|nr:DUF1499 domain-containing protein [Myxacorys almedinensis]NDJ16517.1 DUF1499 domain-containing protein [Myxacorys almedinensis A]